MEAMAKKRPKGPKSAEEILAEFGGIGLESLTREVKKKRKTTGRLTPTQRKATRKAIRIIKRHPKAKAKLRTIPIDVEVKAVQSIRGQFVRGEPGALIKQDSEIIHFFEYDIVTKQLAVQLTAAGKWNWYTYQNVSPQTAQDFEDAGSAGQFFNVVIKKHTFKRGNTIRGFKTIDEIKL